MRLYLNLHSHTRNYGKIQTLIKIHLFRVDKNQFSILENNLFNQSLVNNPKEPF